MFKSDGLAYIFYTKSIIIPNLLPKQLFFGFDLEKHVTDISVYCSQNYVTPIVFNRFRNATAHHMHVRADIEQHVTIQLRYTLCKLYSVNTEPLHNFNRYQIYVR